MNKINNILFLDIETVPIAHHYEELDGRLQKLWDHKCRYLQRDTDCSTADLWIQKAGIYAEFGKVICISLGVVRRIDNEQTIVLKSYHGEEEDVLKSVAQLLDTKFSDTDRYYVCGHNIREFDVPYLSRRMLIQQIPLPYILDVKGKKPWQIAHFIDTLDMWKFGDYKHYTSLDLLAACFGIESPKNDISGADVGRVYYETGDIERIARYCEKDVVTSIQVYLAMQGLPAIDEGKIIARR